MRAAKPSAGNPVEPVELVEPVEPVEPDLALHQRLPKPSPGHSLQPSPEPVEPDLALHQGFLEFSAEPSPAPDSAPNPRRPSQDLLNLTWLSFKASRNLLRNLLLEPVESDLALRQDFLEPSPNPALQQSLPDLLRNLLRNPVELDLALHQSLPDLLRNLLRNFLRNLLRNLVEFDLVT